jgi:hypothetical protein
MPNETLIPQKRTRALKTGLVLLALPLLAVPLFLPIGPSAPDLGDIVLMLMIMTWPLGLTLIAGHVLGRIIRAIDGRVDRIRADRATGRKGRDAMEPDTDMTKGSTT